MIVQKPKSVEVLRNPTHLSKRESGNPNNRWGTIIGEHNIPQFCLAIEKITLLVIRRHLESAILP